MKSRNLGVAFWVCVTLVCLNAFLIVTAPTKRDIGDPMGRALFAAALALYCYPEREKRP